MGKWHETHLNQVDPIYFYPNLEGHLWRCAGNESVRLTTLAIDDPAVSGARRCLALRAAQRFAAARQVEPKARRRFPRGDRGAAPVFFQPFFFGGERGPFVLEKVHQPKKGT